jgi:hypothetical protein
MTARTLAFAVLFTLALPPALAAQCPVGQTPQGEGTLLRLRLKPGDSRRLLSTSDQTVDQTIMGQEQQIHQLMATGMRYDVGPGSAGGASVRATFESIRYQMDNPMVQVDYDSSHPDSVIPPSARPFAALVGHAVTVHLAADGAVGTVDGVDSLLDAIMGAIQLPPNASREAMLSTLKKQFGDRAMGQTMEQAIVAFPERQASVGDSWTCTTTVDVPFPVTRVSTWTLRSRTNGVAAMDVSIRMQSDSATSVPAAVPSMTMRYVVSGTMAGSEQVDEKTGWVVRSSMEGDIAGTVHVEGSPAGDLAMPIKVHMNNTVEPAGT